jgi:hypothetical protein
VDHDRVAVASEDPARAAAIGERVGATREVGAGETITWTLAGSAEAAA